jgi:hypothetical protein
MRHTGRRRVKIPPDPTEPIGVRHQPHSSTLLRLRLATIARRGLEVLIFPVAVFVVLVYAAGTVWAVAGASAALGVVLAARYLRQLMRLEPTPLPRRLR